MKPHHIDDSLISHYVLYACGFILSVKVIGFRPCPQRLHRETFTVTGMEFTGFGVQSVVKSTMSQYWRMLFSFSYNCHACLVLLLRRSRGLFVVVVVVGIRYVVHWCFMCCPAEAVSDSVTRLWTEICWTAGSCCVPFLCPILGLILILLFSDFVLPSYCKPSCITQMNIWIYQRGFLSG